MIVSGSREAVLKQVRFVDIHGTVYCDIEYAHTADGEPRSARIGKDDIYANPQAGDTVQVRYMMNVVTDVQRAS
jgi:hypothetical protein